MNVVEDVVFQILLKLEVGQLIRCRCVCKEWCALIKSRRFKDSYLALRRAMAVDDQVVGLKRTLVSDIPYQDMVVVLRDVDGELKRRLLNDIGRRNYTISVTCWSVEYESLALSAMAAPSSSSCRNDDFEISGNYSGTLRIVNHVDGIVCFINGDNWFDITLVNPALRETRKLPIPTTFNLGGFKSKAQKGIGFGYGDGDEYKVVAIVTVFEQDDGFRSPYKHMGLVYYLSTHSWKILGDMSAFVSPFVCFLSDETIFSHGSIHWCIQSHILDPNYRILAFDMTSELFREIQFPHGWRHYTPYENDAMYPHLFTVFDKSTIALVNSTNQQCDDVQTLQVWVMKEYGDTDSWTKQYSITCLPRFSRALTFWKKDKLLILSQHGYLLCYDLFKGQLDEPERLDPLPLLMPGIREVQLVSGHETLVSVKQV